MSVQRSCQPALPWYDRNLNSLIYYMYMYVGPGFKNFEDTRIPQVVEICKDDYILMRYTHMANLWNISLVDCVEGKTTCVRVVTEASVLCYAITINYSLVPRVYLCVNAIKVISRNNCTCVRRETLGTRLL